MEMALCFSYFWFFSTADKIMQLRPDLEPERVELLAGLIEAAAEETDINPDILLAISMQESSLEEKAFTCSSKRSCDHGLAQINSLWVRAWKLDKKRLIRDDEYNLSVAVRILVDLKARFGREPNWWARYHSSTPKFKLKYQRKVRRWLRDVSSDNLVSWSSFPYDFILSPSERCLGRKFVPSG